uniref:Recombinase domain-containing protein n=1 Tax=Ascaris lumbricoides TaxID=6252 RepID=A0A0M3ILG7_ASCLU
MIGKLAEHKINGFAQAIGIYNFEHKFIKSRLKSGWSVRTATARSPTNAKQQNGGITEAEQEHIKAVLARAEAGRIIEQQRIGFAFKFPSNFSHNNEESIY